MANIELATTVVLVGLSIVFITLIGLTLVFMLYGKIVNNVVNKKKDEPTPPAPTKAAVKSAPVASPAVETGIGDDVIAAIAAAVACMMGDSTSGYTIRSVKRAVPSRKVWQAAGIMQNTRPF